MMPPWSRLQKFIVKRGASLTQPARDWYSRFAETRTCRITSPGTIHSITQEDQSVEGRTAPAKEIPPPIQMLQISSGFWVARCVYVVAKLAIADLIKDESKTADELATATGTHGPSLYRILRALAAVGVITQDRDNRFGGTPLSQTLCSGPGSIRAFAMTELGEEHYPAWGELLYSVRTGGIAFDKAFGEGIWEFFAKNPENAQIFNDAMSGMTAQAQRRSLMSVAAMVD
jgi:hypothetical protein